MPFSSVKLVPGVNVQMTPTLAQTNYVAMNLGRFQDGLFQKLGGWERYYALPVSGIVRDLHAWADFNEIGHLALGSTTQLGVITSDVLADITPQTMTTSGATISTTSASATVGISDASIANVTSYDSIFFETPVAIGGLILSGAYPIVNVTGTTTYQITAQTTATSTASASANIVPSFQTASGTPQVTVTLANHGLSAGDRVAFEIPTVLTGSGVTILRGAYTALTIPSSSTFTISAPNQASAAVVVAMNSNQVSLRYAIAQGPPAAGVGYGLGTYGTGAYGLGVVPSAQQGAAIVSEGWQLDNWGSTLIACQRDGGLYEWSPTGGFATAKTILNSPTFSRGAFVSGQAPILIAYGASQDLDIGEDQDSLLIRNSDFENYEVWTESTTNQARRARLPTGSRIVGGIAGPKFDHIWTDVDFWTMSYAGFPLGYDLQPTGTACGLIGQHAVVRFRDAIYWMGQSNFFVYTGGGVQIIPCSVWDAVFQNINMDQAEKIRCGSNTPFNEIWWWYPSAGQTENDKYVKYNATENTWDFGDMPRTAWIDQSVLGNPIATISSGLVYQHEQGYDADGAPMAPYFDTGYAEIAAGEQFLFLDQWLPDMRWGTYPGNTGAQLTVTFNVVNFPGETPRVYGPYNFNKSTQYVMTRMRGRQISMRVQSSDAGSFWRLGLVRFRWSTDGRR